MRKHFLLLFLMALLPLAGFAVITPVDISTSDVTITLEVASPTYNNAVQTPTITKVVVNGVEYTSEWTQFFTPKYYKRNSGSAWIEQNANQIQDAGVYGVTIVANGAIDAEREFQYTAGKESAEASRVTYTIQKKDLNVTLANGTKQYGGADPTELDITPTNLPTGWTTPEFSWTGTLPIEGAHANVSAEGYPYNFPQNTLEGQTFISAVNYNVFITNQPKLIITKKSVTLDYSGTVTQPSKVYGVDALNTEFLAAIKDKANYALATGNSLEGSDELTTVLAGITGDGKVTTAFNYVSDTESANADATGTLLTSPAEHKLTITIDESVGTNYNFTVNPVNLTVKQATLATAATDPFTFTKNESAAFTYNADNQNLTKTVTYTANGAVLLQDGSTTVTPQVVVSYKVKPLDQTTAATTDATNTKGVGIYEAYIAPVDGTGNFYTAGYNPIRVEAFDFTINKKALYVYVTNDAITETYKGSAYDLPTSAGITFQGLIGGDATTYATAIAAVKAVVNGTTTTSVTNADTYTIIPDVPATSDLRTNYDVQAYTSTFTVSPLAITIDPKDMENVAYGTAIAGTTAATATNVTVTKNVTTDPDIKDGDKTTIISAYNVVVANQDYAAGGTYTDAITLAKKEGLTDAINLLLENFAITEAKGNVSIGTGSYSIVVKNKNKTYGDALAWTDFEDYLTPGLTGSTKPASVKFILVNKADATDSYSQYTDANKLPKNAGTYLIKVDAENSNLTIANYGDPTLVDGELTIAQKNLTITPNALTLNEGATTATLNKYGTVSYEGLVEGDQIDYSLAFNTTGTGCVAATGDPAVLISPKADDPYTAGVKVVASDISIGFANKNYNITKGTGALTIIAASTLILATNDADLKKKIDDANESSAKVSFVNQTTKTGEWYAMVLPFEVDPVKMVKAFNRYVIFNVLNEAKTTAQEFKFTLTLDPIPAGTPFLIKFANNANGTKATIDWSTAFSSTEYGDVEIAKVINDVEVPGLVTFTGTYEQKSMKNTKNGDNDADINANVWWLCDTGYKDGAKGNTWLKPTSTAHTTKAMEAYLIAGGDFEVYAPNITVEDFDGQTTAIKSLSVEQINNLKTDGLYNLQGVKMQNVPTQKGVYIMNGKKVVIK